MFVFLGQGCSLQTKPVTSSGLSLERLSEGLEFFFSGGFYLRSYGQKLQKDGGFEQEFGRTEFVTRMGG